MDKKEYAQKIAELVNGEVQEVNKNNGVVLTGIAVRKGNEKIYPTVYIDKMYEEELDVEEASAKVLMIAEQQKIEEGYDLSWMNDFEEVKPRLRALLLNRKSNVEVWKPAEHGFDDLIIVPIVTFADFLTDHIATSKVTLSMLKKWNVDAEDVIRIAEENSKDDTSRRTIMEAILGIIPNAEFPPMPEEEYPMYVVSNNRSCNGAYAVIPMLDELHEMFPEGFVVIPSSVHEVLIVPKSMPEQDMNDMVNEVNDAEVDITDQLSDHVYIF